MKRSASKRKPYERAPAVITPIPGEMRKRISYAEPAANSQPVRKFAYVRDERLRDMCRAMPCQACGRQDEAAGVTWAHSNWAKHGKGKAVKASDVYVAALCWDCHSSIDQGGYMTGQQRREMWCTAHAKTIAFALTNGLWPAGIEPPKEP